MATALQSRWPLARKIVEVVGGQVVSRGTNAALAVVVAAVVSVDDFGRFNVLQSLFVLTSAFGVFGFDILLLKGRPSDPAISDRQFYCAKLLVGLAVGACLILYSFATLGASLVGLSVIAVAAGLFAALAETPESRLAVANDYTRRAVAQIAPTFVITAVSAAILLGAPLRSRLLLDAGVLLLLVREASHFTSAAVLRRKVHLGATISVSLRGLVKRAAPYASVAVLSFVYFRVDALILQGIKGPHAVAGYGAEYNILMGALAVSSALGTLWLRLLVADEARWRRLLPANVLLGLCLAGMLYVLSDPLTLVVYGHRYQGAAALLRILAVVLPLSFCDSLQLRLIYVRDLQRWVGPALVGITLANVSMNLIVIPFSGARGAAWTTVITEGLMVAAFAAILRWGGARFDAARA